jgi:DNA-directed RNA polymerase subunit H (RpoH/RPB5)
MSEIEKLYHISKNKIKEINGMILEIYRDSLKLDDNIKEEYNKLLLLSGNVPKMEILSEKEVTNIIHISDIHIRKSSRISSYNHV